MNSEVFTQKVSLQDCKKILVKIIKKEDEDKKVPGGWMTVHSSYLPEIYGMEKRCGCTFVTEEWVYGISLDGVLRGRGGAMGWKEEFSVGEIIEIGVQVCRGVECLHSQNPPIFHGDIKPENILLTHRFPIHIKIIDIDDGFAWQPNVRYPKMKGTLGFAAPEQTTGSPCDFTLDVYGIGATLEFLLTGCTKGSVRKRVLLKRIIRKATSEKRENRYVSVRELEKRLKQLS